MKTIRIPFCFILSVFLFSNTAFGFETKEEKSKEIFNKMEFKALVKCAKVKIKTFKFQANQIKDIKFLENQLVDLQNKRLEISKAVKRLENLAKMLENKKNNKI